MARFQINDQIPIQSICLDNAAKPEGSQKKISLQYTTADKLITGGLFINLQQSQGYVNQKKTLFTVEAKPGATGKTYVLAENGNPDKLLEVYVGRVTNHQNFTVDLFAELLGRSEDPKKLLAYQRALALKNNTIPSNKNQWNSQLADQPLKQITFPAPPQQWNCGGALISFAESFLGRIINVSSSYYDKPKSGQQGDLLQAINSDKMQKGVNKIINHLNSKAPVLVFASHHYPVSLQNGIVQPSNKTHYLSIIGHSNKDGKLRFLYIDPWPGGSKLTYTSGIFGNVQSVFMGILEFSGGVLQTPASLSRGQSHDYLVLSGP
jgi:hypothetical protein